MSRTKQCARRGAKAKAKRRDDNTSRDSESSKKQKVDSTERKENAAVSAEAAAPAMNTEQSLSELLGGMPIKQFLDEYFEKKPLVVRSSEAKKLFGANLFNRQSMLDVMTKHQLAYGQDLMVCKYVNGEKETFVPNPNAVQAKRKKVNSLLDNGYSCQFYQPQRYADGLYRTNAAFEAYFGCLAGSSAYLTPPGAQALAPHHDDVEVFILQTEGSKHWKLYKPLTELAGEYSRDLDPAQIGEPWMELTLNEGDLLYFPRGVIHQASTSKEFSTHVTISVYQHNSWANFMEVALPRIIRRAFDADVEFRRGLPINYLSYMGSAQSGGAPSAEFVSQLRTLVERLAKHVDDKDVHEAADEAAVDFVSNRLPPTDAADNATSTDGASPLDSGASFRLKSKQFMRLARGTEEGEEFAALYYSVANCRRHHMGMCDCESTNNREDNEEDEDESGSGSDDDEGAMGGMAPGSNARCIALPVETMKSLQALLGSEGFVTVDDLHADDDEEVAVRGMLLRLWSEGLLEMRSA
ncbi:TPA: hypothetical protein N0F65_005916 [Lagenidium giganteum]|uniref:Bifunctional lysine-specific demethylase and histidyl-hydroxylase n=1 Tax=Lagenidium giganteum TaxID=4803 RepID=A0AAV2ZA53_9STRA|nr:TPA: hypothetical protein N0F65_005916 [Lagenidium giganteum]